MMFYNSQNGQISSVPVKGIDYGIRHFNSDNQTPAMGMHEEHYEPESSNFPKRDKYLDKYGPVPLTADMLEAVGGIHHHWPAVSPRDFINVACLVRCFFLSDFFKKKEILLNKLGFDDAGVSVGGDMLYVYRYSCEPTQAELYLKNDTSGRLTEVNRFNNSKFEELRVSLNFNGIHYLFCQVFSDINKVSFSKLRPAELGEDNIAIYQNVLNLSQPFYEIDAINTQDLPPFLSNE